MESANFGPDDGREILMQQFQEICATEDRTLALNYLQRFQWDLEEAVQDYLIARDGTESTADERLQNAINYSQQQSPNSSSQVSTESVQNNSSSAAGRRNNAVVGRRVGWIEWTWSLLTLPLRFVFVTLWDLWNFLYTTFFDYNRAITLPADDVDTFITEYEAKYGVQHPTFYRGSYSQALTDAKKELKFLCVYLHCETHRNTDAFCRNTLNNQQVADILNTRTLLWACSVKLREGYRVSQAMHETSYPFLAMICLRENRMMVVARQEGYLDPIEFIRMLNTVINDNEAYLNSARQQRMNQLENQQLREQQEHAFQDSLRRDREKEQRRQEERERERRQAEEVAERENQTARRRQALQERREKTRLALSSVDGVIGEADDVLRVSIRFPDGCRLERRFGETQSLMSLFDVVMSHDSCPDNFSVFNTFPRQKLLGAQLLCAENENMTPDLCFETFLAAGLHNSAALFVQNNDS